MTHLFENYARWDVEIVSGSGANVKDTTGKDYLDFTSGIGVCNLGHCHPQVVEATANQLEKIWHTSNLFKSSLQEEVAEKLTSHSMGEYVFFCNSGAEANEAAIKLARKFTEKSKIITFLQSFHGRTFATMAATGQDKVKQGFGSMLETFVHLPYNDVDALKNEIGHETAAIMLEIVQGEGGVHVAEEDFLATVEQLCKDYGVLLIIDEVQTGIGRTGKPFAYQHFNLSPDIITSAKGLGNGFPTGAMIGKKYLKDAFNPGSHGSTFGGNPLAMSAAKATLDLIFEEEFLNEVTKKGEYFVSKLEEIFSQLEHFKTIRHKGLMVGVEFSEEVGSMISLLRENGLLALVAGPNVIRFLPPLTVTYGEMDAALGIISGTLLDSKKVTC
ncbi:acetylornithine transaminase [Lederbergia wuyishanensis]|uniref:Acetylornithine aminotransferase n=1 Tax=Lederbergia wuyishanensis TaxID=1347903 RepID=A0ABU0D039_9BACI|nr:acetylornithine transaminase [Lederbergia wuyishanensis]MCJ8006400.1 acetylornithine transaminase [Lederbergia wuyishanensis]MDQ0341770.1 acetylornithine aminotransferase [Lederbergia wuyishanensis]